MAMTSLNISLPESLKAFVEKQVDEAGYSTPSEYVRELLRADRKRRADERIEALVMEGLNSGPGVLADAKYWKSARQELTKRLKAKKRR